MQRNVLILWCSVVFTLSLFPTTSLSAQPDLTTQIRCMRVPTLDCGRDFPLQSVGIVNQAPRVPKPQIISKAEWGGKESSGTLRAHRLQRITLHHEGSAKPLTQQDDPMRLLRNLQAWGAREKGWADIPYHYLIDLEGRIYAARDPNAVGDTSTTYDPTGHLLVTLMGNYELQMPTKAQLDTLCDFLAWLCDYYNIHPGTIGCHMEYAQTACPGRYFAPYVFSGYIEAEVRKRLREAYVAGQ